MKKRLCSILLTLLDLICVYMFCFQEKESIAKCISDLKTLAKTRAQVAA